MAVLNAIPAAEGVVEFILRSLQKTIHNSRILIMDGRIGKGTGTDIVGFWCRDLGCGEHLFRPELDRGFRI